MGDVVFNLTYREFSAEMLQSLISQSLHCKQNIRYDCYKAPLELHSYTWFRSAAGNLLDSIPMGKAQPGRCPCSRKLENENKSISNSFSSFLGFLVDVQRIKIVDSRVCFATAMRMRLVGSPTKDS